MSKFKSVSKYVIIVFAILTIEYAVFFLIENNKPVPVPDRNMPLSLEKYAYPQKGMAYEYLKDIFGEGKKEIEVQGKQYKTEKYIWEDGKGGRMELVFNNGKLESKYQEGLK